MDFGTLAQTLMQKFTRMAGDATKVVTIRYADGPPVYDPVTGSSTGPTTDVVMNYGLTGNFTVAERIRWGLNERVEKIVLASADCARLPDVDDYAIYGGVSWRITKVMRDMAGLTARVAATVDAVTHEVDGEIHSRTPVWSGKAVRNMIWTLNAPNAAQHAAIDSGEPGATNSMSLGSEPRRPANEAAAQATLEAIKIARPFGIYYLSNVADHIVELEHGLLPSPELSRAPAGMFGVTYASVSSKLRAGAFS